MSARFCFCISSRGRSTPNSFSNRVDLHAFVEEIVVDPWLSDHQGPDFIKESRNRTGFRGPGKGPRRQEARLVHARMGRCQGRPAWPGVRAAMERLQAAGQIMR